MGCSHGSINISFRTELGISITFCYNFILSHGRNNLHLSGLSLHVLRSSLDLVRSSHWNLYTPIVKCLLNKIWFDLFEAYSFFILNFRRVILLLHWRVTKIGLHSIFLFDRVVLFLKWIPHGFEWRLILFFFSKLMILIVENIIYNEAKHLSEFFFIKGISAFKINSLKQSMKNCFELVNSNL